MALNDLYYVTSDITNYAVDKDTGMPLSNGILYFYRDSERTVLKDIFTLTGSPPAYEYTALPNPMTLSAVGTTQDAGGDNVLIYYYPWIVDPDTGNLDLDLYYIVCTDSAGTVQFTREAWPNIANSGAGNAQSNPLTNQISNPTFTNVFLNPGIPTTITVTGTQTLQIGPDWFLTANGNGTVTVQQVPKTGNNNIDDSPPYVLQITTTPLITTCNLIQRFPNNSGLWASTGDFKLYLSGGFIASATASPTLSMYYSESSGVNSTTPVLIATGNPSVSTYSYISGSSVQIPESTNTDSGVNGYVQIYITIVGSTTVNISSVQLYPTVGAPPSVVPIDVNSSNRNEAYQGDYYIPRNNAKPTNSFLVGWDFPVNPFQFGSSGSFGNTVSNASYIADQTIAVSATSSVTWGRDTLTNGLVFNCTGTNDAFYLLQYLNLDQVRDMIGGNLAVNVFGYQNDSIANNPITMTINLYSTGATAIPLLSSGTTIGTISPTGIFTLTAAGWRAITRNGPAPQITLNEFSSNLTYEAYDYGFSQWNVTSAVQTANMGNFAIVVTFAYVNPNTNFTINSISLVPGDLPCRPAIKSADEVLRQCQYYYEKSYSPNVLPGTLTSQGSLFYQQIAYAAGGGTLQLYAAAFDLKYLTVKRISSLIFTFYDPSVTNGTGRILFFLYSSTASSSGSGAYTNAFSLYAQNVYGIQFMSNTTLQLSASGGSNIALQGVLNFQYTADARLGVV